MKPNQLLQSSLLDIVFDERNKMYGAYELRKNYSRRVGKALIITGVLVGALISLSFVRPTASKIAYIPKSDSIKLTIIVIPKDPIPIIPQQVPANRPEARTVDNAVPVIVTETTNEIVPNEELTTAIISDVTHDGPDATTNVVTEQTQGTGTVIPEAHVEEDVIMRAPEVDAMYEGDWIKFLNRQLNAQVPADHEAPAGNYRVLIQFVVDVDGTISNITPLTKMGYGMEEEQCV